MSSYLSVRNRQKEYVSLEVPEDVAIYVKQLEFAIKYPEVSKIKEAYPGRFAKKEQQMTVDTIESPVKEVVFDCHVSNAGINATRNNGVEGERRLQPGQTTYNPFNMDGPTTITTEFNRTKWTPDPFSRYDVEVVKKSLEAFISPFSKDLYHQARNVIHQLEEQAKNRTELASTLADDLTEARSSVRREIATSILNALVGRFSDYDGVNNGDKRVTYAIKLTDKLIKELNK